MSKAVANGRGSSHTRRKRRARVMQRQHGLCLRCMKELGEKVIEVRAQPLGIKGKTGLHNVGLFCEPCGREFQAIPLRTRMDAYREQASNRRAIDKAARLKAIRGG